MQKLMRSNETIIEELLVVDAMIDQIKGKWNSIDGDGRKRYRELEERKQELLQKLAISS